MTDQTPTAAAAAQGSPPWRDRALLLMLSALSAALLFLPVVLLGYTFAVLARVARGEYVLWHSVVAMSYTFIGFPALLALGVLAFIAWRLSRTRRPAPAARRALWVGAPLVAWHAGLAVYWGTSALGRSTAADDRWLAAACGLVAVAILFATLVAERRGTAAAVRFVGVPAAALAGALLLAVVLVDKPITMPIPAGAQRVEITVSSSAIRLSPALVDAGDVYFVVQPPGAEAAVTLVYRLTAADSSPGPLSEEGVSRVAAGDYQDTSITGLGADVSMLTLSEGNYVFLTADAEGGQPGIAPSSIAVLRVGAVSP